MCRPITKLLLHSSMNWRRDNLRGSNASVRGGCPDGSGRGELHHRSAESFAQSRSPKMPATFDAVFCPRTQTQSTRVPSAKIQASRMASPPCRPASDGRHRARRSRRRAGGEAARFGRRAPCCRRPAPRRTARVRSTGRAAASTLRARWARRCEYSSWRSSSGRPISTLESEPMPKRPPFARKSWRRKSAVAEIGLGDRAQAGDRAAAGHGGRSRHRSCGWRGSGTSARRPRHCRAAIRPAARPTRRRSPRPRCTCSATWMWIGPSARQRDDRGELVRRHGAQAVRRDADDGARARSQRACAAASSSRAKLSRSLMKRRWPSIGAAPPKPEWA